MTHPTFAQQPASTELHLSAEQRSDLAAWASEGHPHETCGLMIGRAAAHRVEVERVVLARNLNQERAVDRYEIAPEDIVAADKAARDEGLDIVGFWHTHPDCPARPSTTDLKAAWEGYSYLIIGVTGEGHTDFHSWRLEGELFFEEPILPEDPRPPAPALRFENPLKEERKREDLKEERLS